MSLLQLTINLKDKAIEEELPYAVEGDNNFGDLLSHVLEIALMVGALLLLLYLIWGGIEWITAAGDSSKVGKARDKITQAVIGIIVLASTVAIFIFVQNMLGFCALKFGGSCSGGSDRGGGRTIITCSRPPMSEEEYLRCCNLARSNPNGPYLCRE